MSVHLIDDLLYIVCVCDRAESEAGISLLDSMATDEERLSRLSAIRLVTF